MRTWVSPQRNPGVSIACLCARRVYGRGSSRKRHVSSREFVSSWRSLVTLGLNDRLSIAGQAASSVARRFMRAAQLFFILHVHARTPASRQSGSSLETRGFSFHGKNAVMKLMPRRHVCVTNVLLNDAYFEDDRPN